MELTGIPLITLVAFATLVSGAATVWLWSRFGRWRLLSRTLGVLLCEALVVFTAGLIANRSEQFYPSWQALAGNTGTASTTATAAAGRLDKSFAAGVSTLAWQPAGASAWHLSGAAQVRVPAGYTASKEAFPVLLSLGGTVPANDLVDVTLKPGPQSTAAALAELPGKLAGDVRVTGHGWTLVAAAKDAKLAAALAEALPGRFTALAVVGSAPPGFRPPPGIPVAVTGPRPGKPAPQATVQHPPIGHQPSRKHKGAVHKLPVPGALPEVTYLTGSWAAAAAWALGRTATPLAPPQVLPPAVIS